MARIHSPQTESAQPSLRLAALIFHCAPAGHVSSPWLLFLLCSEPSLRGLGPTFPLSSFTKTLAGTGVLYTRTHGQCQALPAHPSVRFGATSGVGNNSRRRGR